MGSTWGAELAWFFRWSGSDLGERSSFPSGEQSLTGFASVVEPGASQCAAARKWRRVARVLRTLSKSHQAVLERAYGSEGDTPRNLAAQFGITQLGAVVAWSMHRALMRQGRKVTEDVAREAQQVLDDAHDLYAAARQLDEDTNPRAYPRSRRVGRQERVQAWLAEVDSLVA